MEGDERLKLLEKAASGVNGKDKAKTKEEENIRSWMQRFHKGSLQETLLGDAQFTIHSYKSLTNRPMPDCGLEEAAQSLTNSKGFSTWGAKYL